MPKTFNGRQLPCSLTNIRCCTALNNCGATRVEEAYKACSASKVYVYDDHCLKHSDWTDVPENVPGGVNKCFSVSNPGRVEIVLLPLDNCILSGKNIRKGGICDCLLLTDDIFVFVEFKTDVYSEEHFMDRVAYGIKQLKNTFNLVKQKVCCAMKQQDLPSNIKVEFHIVFDCSLMVTGASADIQNAELQFLLDCNYPLYVDNSKDFSEVRL